jgi:Putative Actinobacterial Holin-X, holin superfamily III
VSEVEKTAAPAEPASDTAGLLDNVVALSRDVELLAREQFALASLEAKLATRSVVVMIAAAVAVGVLLVSVWLALVAALVWSLLGIGLTPLWALLSMAVLNLLAGWVLVAVIRRHGRNLGFPATRRSLAMLAEVGRAAPQ